MHGTEFLIGVSQHDAKEIAKEIAHEAQQIISDDALSDHYNVFIFDNHIELEPVSGPLGSGVPAEPQRYRDYFLNVPLAHLETPESVVEYLDLG